MGTLLHTPSGTNFPLAARLLVGRSRQCPLRIDQPGVSGMHAEFIWDRGGWHLRDLGSRNGTFVGGERLEPGQQRRLEAGVEVGIGEPACHYRLVDAAPPGLIAFGAATHLTDRDMLCLPGAVDCEAMILRDGDGRWVLEAADGPRPIADEELVVVAGQAWRIHLPMGSPATREPGDADPGEATGDDGALELAISRDGEHVDVWGYRAGTRIRLDSRAHAFLLVELARARMADSAQAHLVESEHGWIHREELSEKLRIDPQLLNLWVYRARQQFAQARLSGASRFIERREGAGQLRLGVRNVRFTQA